MRPIINTVASITFARLAEIEKKDWDGSFNGWDRGAVLSLLAKDYDIEDAIDAAGIRNEYDLFIGNDLDDVATVVLGAIEGLKLAA